MHLFSVKQFIILIFAANLKTIYMKSYFCRRGQKGLLCLVALRTVSGNMPGGNRELNIVADGKQLVQSFTRIFCDIIDLLSINT